jgi:dienelactone hydrolase
MSQKDRRHEIANKRIVLEIPGADAVVVRRDVAYALVGGERLSMDIYRPAGPGNDQLMPAVLFVTGYPDEGMRKIVGCNAKEMASYVSWAQLMAASGLVAITYTNRNPVTDVHDVLRYVRAHADLGIDGERVGLWACSGNVPTALSVLMEPQSRVKCAALCYGYLLDLDGSTFVAEAASLFRFANPCAGRSLDELPVDVPLFVARAGRDEMPHLNDTIDRFLARALALKLPVTAMNHPNGPHAFDIADNTDASGAAIRQIVAFMRDHLKKSVQSE